MRVPEGEKQKALWLRRDDEDGFGGTNSITVLIIHGCLRTLKISLLLMGLHFILRLKTTNKSNNSISC